MTDLAAARNGTGADVGGSGVHVCLCAIVRDEARVVERMLASCADLLDAVCVCDTGSHDDTPERIVRFGRGRGVRTLVPRHPWVDFGRNRTQALVEAREFVRRIGLPPERTWLLLLDADQELVIEPGFSRAALRADAYSLRQASGNEAYWNVRLVRADREFRYVGPTHEYVDAPPGSRTERLEGLRVVDRNDGGSRGDKFVRDERLLRAALEADPTNPRTLFYLARTYEALGDPLRALALYRRRIARGGWSEEVWHAWFASARIHLASGDLRPARAALLDARRVEPRRVEALALLARVHREQGRRDRAAAAARRGLCKPFPAAAALFVDRRVYDFGLREEFALSAAGTAREAEGRAACEGLLLDRATPADVATRAHRALIDYVRPWPDARHVALAPRLEPPYVPCNPSIVARPDGALVCCRAVNYRQRDARDWQILDAEGLVRTRNVLLRLAPDLSVVSQHEVHGEPPAPRRARIRGFEDLRLIDAPSGLLGFATTGDRHPSGRIGPSLLRLADDGRVLAHVPLVGWGEDRVQKNWLPFLGAGGAPFALASLDPHVVLSVDPESGRCVEVARAVPPWNLARWRNSAGPLPMRLEDRDGDVVLAHEVAHLADARRRYVHRFVWIPRGGCATHASPAFRFRSPGVEFAAGLARAGDGHWLVTFGVEDREAWVARLDPDVVRAALVPIGDLARA